MQGVDARKLSHAICLVIFKMLEKEFLSLTLYNTGDILDPSEIMSETKYKLKVFLGDPSDRIIGKIDIARGVMPFYGVCLHLPRAI